MADNRITVRLEKELRRRIARIARRKSVPPAEVVREALEAYCQSHEDGVNCYDIAKKARVIGVAKGLPSDLSTNPKYLKGLGKA